MFFRHAIGTTVAVVAPPCTSTVHVWSQVGLVVEKGSVFVTAVVAIRAAEVLRTPHAPFQTNPNSVPRIAAKATHASPPLRIASETHETEQRQNGSWEGAQQKKSNAKKKKKNQTEFSYNVNHGESAIMDRPFAMENKKNISSILSLACGVGKQQVQTKILQKCNFVQ